MADEFRVVVLLLRVAQQQVADKPPLGRNVEAGGDACGIQDRNPAKANALNAGRQPKNIDQAGTGIIERVWLGLAAIILFGLPNSFYNALLPSWCAEQFGHHGQGAVMGLISTTFCVANILMALAGSVLTLIDTRLILLLGAGLSTWAAWRIGHWQTEIAQVSTAELGPA